MVILGYKFWLFWSCSGTNSGYFGHTQVPILVSLVINGHQLWLFWSYSGAKYGYFGHTRVPSMVILVYSGTKYGNFSHKWASILVVLEILGYRVWVWSSSGRCARVPRLVGLDILGCAPGYPQGIPPVMHTLAQQSFIYNNKNTLDRVLCSVRVGDAMAAISRV